MKTTETYLALDFGLVSAMSSRDLDADIERAARRARWERRKSIHDHKRAKGL